jgi:oligopeptide transport system permease protein
MFTFILRRLLLFIPTLIAIATLTFFMMRLAPGGPFLSEKDIPKAALVQLQKQYGLDRPLGVQYLTYLRNAAQLDFGPSYKYPSRTVREIIFEAFPVSLELGAWALLLSIVIGVPIGMFAALRQNTGLDFAAMAAALAGVSIPNFVLGPVLVLTLSLGLFLFPPALWQGPASRVLPVLTLATAYVAYIARLTRAGMLEVLRQDFIRTARAGGVAEWKIRLKHALKNTMTSVLTVIGITFAYSLAGAVVIEQVFALPGVGQLVVNAILRRDYPVVQGALLVVACLLVLVNLAIDLLYGVLDPRVRHG